MVHHESIPTSPNPSLAHPPSGAREDILHTHSHNHSGLASAPSLHSSSSGPVPFEAPSVPATAHDTTETRMMVESHPDKLIHDHTHHEPPCPTTQQQQQQQQPQNQDQDQEEEQQLEREQQSEVESCWSHSCSEATLNNNNNNNNNNNKAMSFMTPSTAISSSTSAATLSFEPEEKFAMSQQDSDEQEAQEEQDEGTELGKYGLADAFPEGLTFRRSQPPPLQSSAPGDDHPSATTTAIHTTTSSTTTTTTTTAATSRRQSYNSHHEKSATAATTSSSGGTGRRPLIAPSPSSPSAAGLLFAKLTGSSMSGPSSPTAAATTAVLRGPGKSPAQRRRRANMLRVRIERGLMVGMGLLASYRMMTLDYTRTTGTATTASDRHQHHHSQDHQQQDAMPALAKSAWALGAGFVVLTLVHALFLTAHDHRLQFPLHKNQPLQPLRKRSSRHLNANATKAAAAAVAAADTDDESEDDEAAHRAMAAEMQEAILAQESAAAAAGGAGVAGADAPVFGTLQSRFCRSAEGAMPQWRVWGSEAHWYRKGADNGSIFASVLVPVVLAAKFVQTVTDEKFLSTGDAGIKTAEKVLSNMALSLTFGVSVLVHMLLLKIFEDQPATTPLGSGATGTFTPKGSILDGILLPPPMIPPPSSSTFSATSSAMSSAHSLNHGNGGGQYPRHLQPLWPPSQQQLTPSATAGAVSSPSSPSSPSLSAVSTTVSSGTLLQQQQQRQQQQELQEAFLFSTDQMHHPSLLMGTSESERASDREEIWIIALGFGGAFTGLVTLLARFKWIPGLERTGAGMVMLNQNVFQALMIGFSYFYRRSFTFGELTILAQVITLLIHETLILNFMTTGPSSAGQVLEEPQFLFLLTLVVGMLLIGVLLTPVLMYCRKLAQMPTKGASLATLEKREWKKKAAAGVVYAGLVGIVVGVILPRNERLLGMNPFLWLIEFMAMVPLFEKGGHSLVAGGGSASGAAAAAAAAGATVAEGWSGQIWAYWPVIRTNVVWWMNLRIGWSRLLLCLYWVAAIVFSIGFFYWMNTSMSRRSIMGSLNNRRKYYHALAVVMFVPGYLTDEPFMHIAFSVSLASLIFLEYIRYFAVVPFGKEIHLFLVGFLDGRDGGPIILSHLYLLIGCAAPVWLAEQHILAGLSGIFALGVGDAMASIVGKRFGRHRWPGTIKTVEGTVAFVVSVMMAAGLVFLGMWGMSFVFGTGEVGFWEAVVDSWRRSVGGVGKVLPEGIMSFISLPLPARTVVVPSYSSLAETASFPPASLLSFSTWNDWSAVRWSVWGVVRYGMAVSVAAMLEAVSEQNDNLVMPVLMLAMVWLI